MLLPRRVKRHFRFARTFYVYSWAPWAAAARMIRIGEATKHIPQPLRAAVDPDPHGLLGGRSDPGLRPAALGDRHAAGRQGRSGRPGRLCLFQRRDVLHPGIWRHHAGRAARAVPGRGRDGHRLRLPGRGHQLPSGPVPGVLPPRGHDLAARRSRRLAARRPPRCWAAWPASATWSGSISSSPSGSDGRPKCSRATSRFRS